MRYLKKIYPKLVDYESPWFGTWEEYKKRRKGK